MDSPNVFSEVVQQATDDDLKSEFNANTESMDTTIEEVLQAISSGIGSVGGAGTPPPGAPPKRRLRRGNRMKILDNGYVYTYDKDSQCGQRSFWRCERKGECTARIHTNPVSNQVGEQTIIKRINEHNHPAPPRKNLPKWLLPVSQEEHKISPTHNEPAGGTGILMPNPTRDSTIQALNSLIAHELEGQQQPLYIEDVKPDVSELQAVIERPLPTISFGSMVKRGSHVPTKEIIDEVINQPDEFWEIYHLTKKSLSWLRQEASSDSSEPVNNYSGVKDQSVADLLHNNDLHHLSNKFSRYTMSNLRQLSVDDFSKVCGKVEDGVLLYHIVNRTQRNQPIAPPKPSPSLQNRPSSSSLVDTQLILFFAERTDRDEDPVYQMISLERRCPEELFSILRERGMFRDRVVANICVAGPAGINVALSEKIICGWKNDNVFQFFIQGRLCKLIPINT